MQHLLFSIYDRKAQYYLPANTARTEADAIRVFTEIVTTSETPVSLYPADFDLIGLAMVDMEKGTVHPFSNVRLILNGLVCLENAHRERSRYQAILGAAPSENATDAS